MSGGLGAQPLTLAANVSGVPLRHTLSTARWHMDQRPIVNMVLVHDLLGCAESWASLTNGIAKLPATRQAPQHPLYVYSVTLRGHRTSPPGAADNNAMMAHAADVAQFCETCLPHSSAAPVHLVGFGFGARVAALVALAKPEQCASLTMLLPEASLFAPATVSSAKIQFLADAKKHCKTFAECDEYLRKTVPNATERAHLMEQLFEPSVDGGMNLLLHCQALMSPALMEWPSVGGAHWGQKTPVTVLHNCRKDGGVPAGVRNQTKGLFPSVEFHAVHANLSLGSVGRDDGAELAREVLTYSCGLVKMESSAQDG